MKPLGSTETAEALIARLERGRQAEKELPGWTCPGCGCDLHAPERPEPGDFTRRRPAAKRGDPPTTWLFEYLRAATCGPRCHRKAVATQVPRVEVLERAGAPRRYAEGLFSRKVANLRAEYDPGEVLRWPAWSGDPPTVYIWGENGTGKTWLAAQLAVQCWRAGRIGVCWASAPKLMDEHFNERATSRPLHRGASQAEVLVLDELGRGRASNEYAIGIVGQVLEDRLSRERPTILPSNLRLEPAAGSRGPTMRDLDSAFYDRLAGGLIIRMRGESMRHRRGSTVGE